MSKPDRATVEDFLEYLQDCLLWEDSHEGYEAISGGAYLEIKRRVEELQAYYPLRQLPGEGQERWRELQGGVDACTTTTQVPFFRALDRFLSWLATHYGIVPRSRAAGTEPGGRTKNAPKMQSKRRKDTLTLLKATLYMHHFPGGGECVTEPLTEEALVRMLDCSQPTVSRMINALFPEGGMKAYRAACRREMLEGYRKDWSGDGNSTLEAIYRPDEE